MLSPIFFIQGLPKDDIPKKWGTSFCMHQLWRNSWGTQHLWELEAQKQLTIKLADMLSQKFICKLFFAIAICLKSRLTMPSVGTCMSLPVMTTVKSRERILLSVCTIWCLILETFYNVQLTIDEGTISADNGQAHLPWWGTAPGAMVVCPSLATPLCIKINMSTGTFLFSNIQVKVYAVGRLNYFLNTLIYLLSFNNIKASLVVCHTMNCVFITILKFARSKSFLGLWHVLLINPTAAISLSMVYME